jgi:hypothetical protein
VAQRNDRPTGAIQRTEFGLQVRLPYFFLFFRLAPLARLFRLDFSEGLSA